MEIKIATENQKVEIWINQKPKNHQEWLRHLKQLR